MTAQLSICELPTWDLTPFFPSLDSPEFAEAFARARRLIAETVALFESHQIARGANRAPLDQTARVLELLLDAYNRLQNELETLVGYLYTTISTDTRDEHPQIRLSELEQHLIELAKLETRLAGWLGTRDTAALIAGTPIGRDYSFLIEQARVEARHQMSPAEESLAAEMRFSGGNAWSKMYDNVASQITVTIDVRGESRTMAMPELGLLSLDPDRDVRRRAHEASVDAWRANAVPIAAAMNGIKGEVLTLAERRRWASPLDHALFINGIDRDVLSALLDAAEEAFPACRSYYRAKARAIGLDQLAWYDIFAPLDDAFDEWSFERTRETIERVFFGFSAKLGELARTSFEHRWIDALVRPGKADGAYCINMQPGVSRVFMNYSPSYGALSTLAHELGHAYHNLALAERPAMQRRMPSTLAETASIFCETLIKHAVLADADQRQELLVLDGGLQEMSQVIVDICSRFRFEQATFEARRQREVPVSELCDLMTRAQRETYGDSLVDETLHPFMWAAKGHYYRTDESFYNFPYLFGMLFGLGLYDRYLAEPTDFIPRYDDLLSSTGRANAIQLAARFGIDLRDIAFWRSGLASVTADIDRYVELVDATNVKM